MRVWASAVAPSALWCRFDVDGDQLEGAWALEMGRLKRVQKRSKKGVVEEESWHFVSTGACAPQRMRHIWGCVFFGSCTASEGSLSRRHDN